MSMLPRQSGCPDCHCNCRGHRVRGVKYIMPCCPHPHIESQMPLGSRLFRPNPFLTQREDSWDDATGIGEGSLS